MPLVEHVLGLLRTSVPPFELEQILGRVREVVARHGGARGSRPAPRARPSSERPRSGRAPTIHPELVRCYAILEIPCGAKLDRVRRAWKRLVRLHHPDFHEGNPERQRLGAERIKELNSSKEKLEEWFAQTAITHPRPSVMEE